jgi:hypothetical protein
MTMNRPEKQKPVVNRMASQTRGSISSTSAVVPADAMVARAAKTRIWPTLRMSCGVRMHDRGEAGEIGGADQADRSWTEILRAGA